MDELKLLRDYVSTMECEIESKNSEIKTLTEQNQRLLDENYQFSMKKSYSLTGSVACSECPQTKTQLANLHQVYNLLQLRYDNLQKQKNSTSSSTVRVISTSCAECIKLKKENEEIKAKYDEISKKFEQLQNNTSTYKSMTPTKIYSTVVCTECPKLKQQIDQKNQLIFSLKNELSSFNSKILTLQGQIHTLNSTAPKSIVYTQTVSKQSDLQRITYLNSQLQQYMALVNSLRNEIKQLNEENHQYIYRIRQLEQRPREVQLIEKQLGPEIREQMKALKIEIGQLSNDNILLRRQNATLKREIMNLQVPKNQLFIEIDKPQSSSVINLNEQRRGKHFRKSNINSRINHQPSMIVQQMPYQQRLKYDDISRKIQLLQMENDYLRGTFYSQI